MKIKRYLGIDMRDALKQIRLELGADAVILSTRQQGSGVEVSAAVDDEVLREHATLATGTLPSPQQSVPTPAPLPPPVVVAMAPADGQLAMIEELRNLRQLLERQLAALAWNDYSRREPLRTRMLTELTELGLAQDIALSLIAELPADLGAEQAQRLHYGLLARRLAVCDSPIDGGGVVALLGAAGAGKTTTLAKLALRWLLEHGDDGLAIVTIDDEHIGAAEQARSLGRLLGVPSYRFPNIAAFATVAPSFADERLVLIDTPALVADAAPAEQLAAALRGGRLNLKSMLLLPASAQAGVLDELLRRAQPYAPDCCAITRCDEATSLGAVLSTLARSGLAAALVSEGPRIPEDLRPARAHQLVARAAELVRLNAPTIDNELLAQRFGGQINAAA